MGSELKPSHVMNLPIDDQGISCVCRWCFSPLESFDYSHWNRSIPHFISRPEIATSSFDFWIWKLTSSSRCSKYFKISQNEIQELCRSPILRQLLLIRLQIGFIAVFDSPLSRSSSSSRRSFPSSIRLRSGLHGRRLRLSKFENRIAQFWKYQITPQ